MDLPKETKELYTENYKKLMKEIKGNINRWRNTPCSCVGRINIVKMTVLSNAAYKAPPSMGLSRQEYWSGVLLPSLTDLMQSLSNYPQHFSQN